MFTISNFQLLLIILLGVVIVISNPKFRRKINIRREADQPNSPQLLSYYTDGKSLLPLATGKIGEMHYRAITSMQIDMLLYQVELPFSASIHLLNIPNLPNVDQINPAGGGSAMERVDLEGNYGIDFSLYCDRGEQVQARYVMDPAAMEFSIDYCRSHNWEIIDNSLYFLQSSRQASGDTTIMFDDIQPFVDEIRPRISQFLTEEQQSKSAPYQADRRTNLLCPVCGSALTNKDTYFECANGDGLLVKGDLLSDLHEGSVKFSQTSSSDRNRKGDIKCPSCGHSMQHVNYNGGPVVIDSCSQCPYRWVDGGEIVSISSK